MTDLREILVVGETDDGKLAGITKELLGGAKRLAEPLGSKINLLLIGGESIPLAREGLISGADRVYIADNPAFSEFNSESYTHLISEFCKKLNPVLCLIGHTDAGQEVAPRVAVKLWAGLCMGCIEVRVEPEQGRFIQTRPVYGGKALAEYSSLPGRIQIDTVRPKSMAPGAFQEDKKGEIIKITEEIGSFLTRIRLIRREKQETEGIKLEEAKVIVSGGGGVGSKEGFKLIKDLAQLLKGAIGATRVPVDEGWVPHSLEIGQTGKIVSPDLYIAVGISGATQHITGIMSSKYTVAINKDSNANIFKVSNLGAVADYRELLPSLIENLKVLIQ